MHELSIAEAVVAVASRHAAGRQVVRVELKVGYLRQVVPSALEFAFELLTAEGPLAGAELVIEEVPAQARCRMCGTHSIQAEFPLRCPRCGGLDLELTGGQELLVEALELEDEMTSEGVAHGY